MHAYLEEIISSFKKEDKAKIIEKYKVGDVIKGEVKGYSSFDASLMLMVNLMC